MIHVAILTQGYSNWGGVQTVARGLHDWLNESRDFEVKVLSLAQSRSDQQSRLLLEPSTWFRRSLRGSYSAAMSHEVWGANGAELETQRYRPRRELTSRLRKFDVIQVVSGSAALGGVAREVDAPLFLQVATRFRWEREALLRSGLSRVEQLARQVNLNLVSRQEENVLRSATGIFVENAAMDQFVRESLGIDSTQVHFIPPGVDTERFRPRQKGKFSDGYVLSLCRLNDPRKGLRRVILAYKILVGRNGHTPRLVLAGGGSLPRPLRDLIRQLGLVDRIDVLEEVPEGELPQLYSGATAFVQGSLEEGLGLSTLEAMSCAVPVVATITDGTRETIVDGVTGLLVRQGDDKHVAHELAEKLEECLGSRGIQMGLQARQLVERSYSGRANYSRMAQIYQAHLYK